MIIGGHSNIPSLHPVADASPVATSPVPTTSTSTSTRRIYHPRPPVDFGLGAKLLQAMDQDQHAEYRKENLFYPFASCAEWELASWLSDGSLSQKMIHQFLRLEYVSPTTDPFTVAEHLN